MVGVIDKLVTPHPEKTPKKKPPTTREYHPKETPGYTATPKAEWNSISVESSTWPKAEENFAWKIESQTAEAAGRGGINFRICNCLEHSVFYKQSFISNLA